jgi:hypothetical protein
LYRLSSEIIEGEYSKLLKDLIKAETPYRSADLMALLEVNMTRPSLKHCAIHLRHDKLQDLPLKPSTRVKLNQIPEIMSYNRNDVLITGKIWTLPAVVSAIEMREVQGEKYGVDLISANDSKIGNVVLEAAYGVPKKRGTRREIIRGRDLIPPTLRFQTDTMLGVQKAIEELILIEVETKKGNHTHLTYPKRKKFEYIFTFDGTTYKLAKGGLHSDDKPRILRSGNGVVYRDADVGSYYPSLRQRYNLFPAHLDRARFKEIDARLITERLTAKHKGDKITADTLKITINGIFGKYNYEHFWLYDPLPFYQTTLYGQLLLLMLIEMLYMQGIRTVSANTDGIVCEIPDSKEQVYYETCKEWERQTGMGLEYSDYEMLVTLNVNSYLAIKTGGKVKTKKDFSDNRVLTKQTFVKGYNAPIIATALQAYFKDGITPSETIMRCDDPMDFLFTQRTGKKFNLYYRLPNGRESLLQKTNRYYIANSGGTLVKRDKTRYTILDKQTTATRETAIWKGEAVFVYNDVTAHRPPIRKQFYIDKVQRIIDKIEPKKKLSIFDI